MSISKAVKYSISKTNVKSIILANKMMRQHNLKGFFKSEVEEQDGKAEISVNSERTIPLKSHLDRHVMDDSDLAKLIYLVVNPLVDLEQYYMNPELVGLDIDEVYYDSELSSAVFVYGIGHGNEEQKQCDIRPLIRSIIYEHARLIRPNSDLVGEILSYMKEPSWHLKGIIYIVEHSRNEAQDIDTSERLSENLLSVVPDSQVAQINTREQVAEGDLPAKSDKSKKSRSNSKKPTGIKCNIKMRRFKLEKKTIVIVISILFTASVLGLITTISVNVSEKIGAMIIVGALVCYVWLRARRLSDCGDEDSNKNQDDSRERFVIKSDTVNDFNDYDRTMMVYKERSNFKLVKNTGHEIPLSKDIIIIGRQEGLADLLIADNASIGRQHAKLIKLERGYAVKDMKSVNGTFVNNKPVTPEQPIALLDGDILRLSNEEFTYITK